MSDIVERLRARNGRIGSLIDEAADEIERLRAENRAMIERLREALRNTALRR